MTKRISLIIFFISCALIVNAQKGIIYRFEVPVIDSLKDGIRYFEKMYKRPAKELKLYALINERDGNVEIYLQEYSLFRLPGVLNVIRTSNRKIKITDSLFIPVVFPTDIHSVQIHDDKIQDWPFTGYYVKLIYEKYKLKAIRTSILF